MEGNLERFFKKHDLSISIIDYSRITEIKDEIRDLYNNGNINKALYKDYLQDMWPDPS